MVNIVYSRHILYNDHLIQLNNDIAWLNRMNLKIENNKLNKNVIA